jgi:hypothetical protein
LEKEGGGGVNSDEIKSMGLKGMLGLL